MRKIFNPLMIVGMALSFAACSSDEPNEKQDWKWTNQYLEPISRVEFTAEENK